MVKCCIEFVCKRINDRIFRAIAQEPAISHAVLFLIESDLLNSKQSQIIRHGTFSEHPAITVEKVRSLLREKQAELLGLGSYAVVSLTQMLALKVPVSCTLSSLVEALW